MKYKSIARPKTKRVKFRTLWVLIIALCALVGCARQEAPIEVVVNARCAIIAEAKSGEVLFEKNPEKRMPPASTAKVMTAIVAIENMPLAEEITATRTVVRVQPTKAGLKPGVKYRLKDLIAAILIKSANDAAIVIAEGVSGAERDFVVEMNAKAKELGMENTYFATVSGLPTGKRDSQYTTAEDLIKMMRYALRYKVILEAMSKKETSIYGSDGQRIYLETHNKNLLWNHEAPWGKTGYTREVRRTFVGVNPSFRPRIVFALLKSNDLWDDITTLNNQGLKIYKRNRRTFISDLIDWIKSERQKGRK